MALHHDWDRTQTAAEARRWQLLAAGRRAILDQGLETFTVDDVVRIAGMAKGSFYTYFASRELFLDDLRLALAEDIAAAAREAAAGPWSGVFARMMSAACDWLVANEPLQGLFGATYMANPGRASKEPLVALLSAVLQAGAETGVLRLPVPKQVTATAQMTLDVMREAAARAAAGDGDKPIRFAAMFVESALGFDAKAAARRKYDPS